MSKEMEDISTLTYLEGLNELATENSEFKYIFISSAQNQLTRSITEFWRYILYIQLSASGITTIFISYPQSKS